MTRDTPLRIYPVFGSLWVLSHGQRVVVDGDSGEVGAPTSGELGTECEMVPVGRWLIVRQAEQLMGLAGAFVATGARVQDLQPLHGLPFSPPPARGARRVADCAASSALRRPGTIARMRDQLLVLQELGNGTELLVAALASAPGGAVPFATPDQLCLLEGNDWVFDRGAAAEPDVLVLVSCSRGRAVVIRLLPGAAALQLSRVVTLSRSSPIVPGGVAWSNAEGLVGLISGPQGGQTLVHLEPGQVFSDHDHDPRPVKSAVPLDLLMPLRGNLRASLMGRGGRHWYDIRPMFGATSQRAGAPAQIETPLGCWPGGIIYQTDEQALWASFPWGDLPLYGERVSVVQCALEWPRIWLLIERDRGGLGVMCFEEGLRP